EEAHRPVAARLRRADRGVNLRRPGVGMPVSPDPQQRADVFEEKAVDRKVAFDRLTRLRCESRHHEQPGIAAGGKLSLVLCRKLDPETAPASVALNIRLETNAAGNDIGGSDVD